MLKRQTGNVMFARMWQVYRHAGDENIDTTKPPIFQRRHGDSDRETRPNSTYCKPIIIKMPLDFHLTPGNHQLAGKGVVYCNESFDGAHWMMADPDFAVKRRLADRRHRQSKANIRNGFTVQHHNVTEAQIRDICRQHANDPQLF